MTIYAKATPGHTDVLLIDAAGRTPAVISHLEQAAKLYHWQKVCNFSIPLSEEHDHKPGTAKKLTRWLRSKPVSRSIYNLLLKRHQKKIIRAQQAILRKSLEEFSGETQLFVVRETVLYDALKGLYENAIINRFEHGLSDYTLLLNGTDHGGIFYCVFADKFRSFLSKRNKSFEFVKPLLDNDSFSAACRTYYDSFSEKMSESICQPGRRYALLVMQPAEIMNVNDKDFWTGFLRKCISVTGKAENICYIVKPHPYQSKDAVKAVQEFFTAHKIDFIIPPSSFISTSIEISFSQWEKQVDFVFSPYSSAVFYLSKLYPSGQRCYYYDFDYMKDHLVNAPEHFRLLFLQTEPLIREVFAESCTVL